MGNALQDQLLKAGLVNKKQSQKADKAKRRKQRLAHKGQKADPDQARLDAERDRARQVERDRELNRRRQEEAARKALTAQIRQLVEMNRLPDWQGDVAYAFTDGTLVKRLHVTEVVRRQLGNGRLAIVRLQGQYEPIPSAVADRIATRDPECIIINQDPEPIPDDEDPYAEFKIPDDLMW